MLVIRDEQLAALLGAREPLLVDRLAAHLRRQQADAVGGWDASTLRAFVRGGLARARERGFEWEASYADYLSLLLTFGPALEEHPAVRSVLEDRALPPDLRLERLIEETPSAVWAELRR